MMLDNNLSKYGFGCRKGQKLPNFRSINRHCIVNEDGATVQVNDPLWVEISIPHGKENISLLV